MGCKSSSEKEQEKKKDSSERDDSQQTKREPTAKSDDRQEDRNNEKYKFGGPKMRGEMKSCFDEGGLLYRVIDPDGHSCKEMLDADPKAKAGTEAVGGPVWGFYNDTAEYQMEVMYVFGKETKLDPLGETVAQRVNEEGAEDGDAVFGVDQRPIECRLTVYPGETKLFIRGQHQGYKSNNRAVPLSDAYRERMSAEADERVQSQLANVRNLAHGRTNDEDVLDVCVRQQVPYVDVNFRPEKSSLSRKEDRREIRPVPWLRPTDFLPPRDRKKIKLIDKAEPNDIDQGSLGDCWFLCSVASLAEINGGSKIEDIFEVPADKDAAKERSIGAYRVTINKNGWWEIVIVDDYLPCIGNAPWFAKNRKDPCELWVSLLEKAYAKLHGSYATITGGDALHALQDLSGYPTNRLDAMWRKAVEEEESEGELERELFEKLVHWDEQGYLININTPGVDNSAYMHKHNVTTLPAFEEVYRAAGLCMGHAYSVLRAMYFKKHKLSLLQIRNPWGNGTEWTGAWGDEDSNWKKFPDVASACDFKASEDGTFWMEWKDVKKYFDGGGVCFTKLNWFDYRVRGNFENAFPSVCLEITVSKPTSMFLILSQNDRRGKPKDSVDAKYAAILLSLCTPTSDDSNKLRVRYNSTSDADVPSEKFTFTMGRDVSIKYDFEPSDKPYLLVPRIHDAGATKQYVLGLISERAVGNGISVKFKRLPSDCRIFRNNYLTFQYDGDETADAECDWQFNPEEGTPVTQRGSAIATSK